MKISYVFIHKSSITLLSSICIGESRHRTAANVVLFWKNKGICRKNCIFAPAKTAVLSLRWRQCVDIEVGAGIITIWSGGRSNGKENRHSPYLCGKQGSRAPSQRGALSPCWHHHLPPRFSKSKLQHHFRHFWRYHRRDRFPHRPVGSHRRHRGEVGTTQESLI